jgi:hypothetical protein
VAAGEHEVGGVLGPLDVVAHHPVDGVARDAPDGAHDGETARGQLRRGPGVLHRGGHDHAVEGAVEQRLVVGEVVGCVDGVGDEHHPVARR